MKKNLGKMKVFFIIFFSIILIYGNDFEYKLELDKQNAYLKEAVILTMDINQTDFTKVMLFDFSPVKSDAYRFYLLNVKEEDNYQNTKAHYTYLIYPLKEGNVSISFNLTQKITTKENVAFSFAGNRDNMNTMTTTDIPLKLPSLLLNVKPLPQGTQLIGDFTIDQKIISHEAKAHEPIPVTIEIKGKGFPPDPQKLLNLTGAYTLFKESPHVKRIKKNKDIYTTITYPMALSSDQSFVFNAVNIKAFNPVTQKSYMLTLPQQNFNIIKVPKETLLDTIDRPKPLKKTDWSWIETLLGYIVVFLAGFFTAKGIQWQRKTHVKEHPFAIQIAQTDDPKILLQLLIAQDSKRYAGSIEKLEAHLYGGTKLNINELKRELDA